MLQPSLAFCFSLQPMTAYRPLVIGCKLKQNANEGCNSYASLAGLLKFYCMLYFTCDRSFNQGVVVSLVGRRDGMSCAIILRHVNDTT